jgi:hypothetical protein
LEYFGFMILYPLKQYPNLLLFIVIIAVPITFNAIQLWIVDDLLKRKPSHSRKDSKGFSMSMASKKEDEEHED